MMKGTRFRLLLALGAVPVLLRHVVAVDASSPTAGAPADAAAAAAHDDDDDYCPEPVPVLERRNDMGGLLEAEGFTRGVELGVEAGNYAATVLDKWPSCVEYVMVDVWGPLDNYIDKANRPQEDQEALLGQALVSIAKHFNKVFFCRNLTTRCAQFFEDGHFDWVYVDARHDKKGVAEDLATWWPKVRRGGLMCGHDFVTQWEGPALTGQRWDVNFDGTVDPTGGAVRAAVEEFARAKRRQLQLTYKETSWWTWCMRR